MKKSVSAKKIIVVGLALLLVSCASRPTTQNPADNAARSPASFNQNMVNQSEVLGKMVLLLQDKELENSSSKQKKLHELTVDLSRLSHRTGEILQGSSLDPIPQAVSRDFSAEINTALGAMGANDWDKARTQLTKVTRFCVDCHTMQQGPVFKAALGEEFKSLSYRQKADFHAALRQFDDAIVNYEAVLADPKLSQGEWVEVLQRILAISVRVKNRADLTLDLISTWYAQKPEAVRRSVAPWREHAKKWRTEKDQAIDYFDKAKTLLTQYDQAKNKNDMFIQLLRASGFLHTYLRTSTNANNQEALFMAGRTSKALADMNFWTIPEDYFKVCVQVDERSTWAEQCKDELTKLTKK